jgi:hypothetical protein
MSDSLDSLQSPSLNASERTPSWRQLYLNLRREKGIERLTKALMAAEAAIFERFQELSESPSHIEERAQLQAATDELWVIKIEKLGWPKPSDL